MKYFRILSGLLIALGLLGLSACGGPAATPTVDTSSVYTEIAATALILQTETVLAMPATNTPQVSPTPVVTDTPQVTITNTPMAGTPSVTAAATAASTANTPKSTSQASCDNMQYVADVTYTDGTVVAPGEYMIKTWTIKNLGPCSWNQDYALVWGWGGTGTNWNTMGSVNLTKVIKPGETVDISVSLTAPKAKGTYGANFVMQNDKGFNFPPGQQVSILITVQ